MDNLQNMMAEMQRMQQQMQEMTEKQAAEAETAKAEAAKASRIKTVSLEDLNRLSEKLAAAEDALQAVGEEVNTLKQAILDSMHAAQEEGGVIAQIRTALEQVIAQYPYKEIQMGEQIKVQRGIGIEYFDVDNGYPMLESLFDTIQEFKIVPYDFNLQDNGELEKFIGTLYRTVYCNHAERFMLHIEEPQEETRYNIASLLNSLNATEGRFNKTDKNINISDGYESEEDQISVWENPKENSNKIKLKALNKKRSVHLLAMQNEAMELLLAEAAKYI